MAVEKHAEPTAPHVLIAMSAVMEEIGKVGISKDRRNKDQGYNFRGIDDVYNDLNGILAKNKLLMLPVKMVSTRSEKPTKSGGSVNYTQLTVDFKMVSAVDGSSEIIQTVGEAMDSADKSSNKAQSASMKYACLMVFMIPTEGDNDADATTHEVSGRQTEPPPVDWAAEVTAAKASLDTCKDERDLTNWEADNIHKFNGAPDEAFKAVGKHFKARKVALSQRQMENA
jgi:hypothetical protein